MGKSFDNDSLFELSDVLTPVYDDGVITIKDFYKNPDAIYEWLQEQDYPLWKYNSELKTGKNSVDYNDCRLIHNIGHPTRKYFNNHDKE